MRKLLSALLAFFLPTRVVWFLLNALGHKIHPSAKIGFTWLWVDRIYLDAQTSIGHLNLIAAKKILLRQQAFIKNMNRIRGPINLLLRPSASLSNSNSVYRGGLPWHPGFSTLKLGKLGQIVSQNKLDLTKSITVGDNSTVGGLGGQMWTHGYQHERTGAGRIRIDGEIVIGSNVYIGSRCTLNPGVFIADGISVGSNVCVAKSLTVPGMYVPQALRCLPNDIEQTRAKLARVEELTVEEVYEKRISHFTSH